MLKKQLGIYLLVTVLIILMGACTSTPSDGSGRIVAQSSQDWGQLKSDGGYILINNVWNKLATKGPYKQKVFKKISDGKPVFGWQWQWGESSTVVAYPEVAFGDKPWDPPQRLVAELPLKAGSKSIRVDFNINLEATGTYNMAFEIMAVSSLPVTKEKITHEIMIWNVNQGMTPCDQQTDTIEVDGNTFDVFMLESHTDDSGVNTNRWTYIAFSARTPILKGPLMIDPFINYLLDKGILSRDNYITSVELGNEIIQGTGIVEISDYAVTIE